MIPYRTESRTGQEPSGQGEVRPPDILAVPPKAMRPPTNSDDVGELLRASLAAARLELADAEREAEATADHELLAEVATYARRLDLYEHVAAGLCRPPSTLN